MIFPCGFIYISVTTDDTEHFSMCLLTILITVPVFYHFINFFFLLICMCSLYILDMSPLADIFLLGEYVLLQIFSPGFGLGVTTRANSHRLSFSGSILMKKAGALVYWIPETCQGLYICLTLTQSQHSYLFNSLIQHIFENLVDARYCGTHWEPESGSKKRLCSSGKW